MVGDKKVADFSMTDREFKGSWIDTLNVFAEYVKVKL